MFEYTKENHYQFGWNDTLWDTPSTNLLTYEYFWKIGVAQQHVKTWHDACIDAAKHIHMVSGKEKIYLAFSGGIDSEVAARSLIEAKVPFIAAIIQFKYNLNQEDVFLAKKFCQNNTIPFKIFELDILKFLDESIDPYINSYLMISPQIPAQLWLLDQIDDYSIFCGGDLRISRIENNKNQMYIRIKPQTSTVHRAMIKTGKQGCPYFHIHTADQVLQFLEDPLTKLFIKQSFSMKMINIKWYKPIIYESNFPNLEPRRKLTGFELFEPVDIKIRKKLELKNLKYNPDIQLPLDLVLNMLKNGHEFVHSSQEYWNLK